jgi:alkanesulfonate monooxygenase SsuD/methylene tetrahydromethanopterin reductase-like flavin-dependent oxidoreductase (luciferase family)
MNTKASNNGAVQFGIFDWIEWDRLPAHEIYEQRLKMLEYADKQDFYCYHLAEHHITPLSLAPSPGIFLSAAAQRTKRIHLGPMVYLLPFYSPLRLLHEICMLDQLSRGRLELGVGRGIVPMEAERYNVNPDEGWAMFNEALEVLLRGFTQDVLNFQGKYYSYNDVQLWMRPYQKPYPPLWYASHNIETVPWMARHGFNTSHVFATSPATRPHFDLYRKVWQEHQEDASRLNGHVAEPKLGITRHVYIAPTDEDAIRECRTAFKAWFHNINFLWDKAGLNFLDFVRNFDDLLAKEIIIAGSPKTVREQVQRTVEESGVNYFCSIFAWGDISHTNTMRSMDYFAREVIPAFRQPGSRARNRTHP